MLASGQQGVGRFVAMIWKGRRERVIKAGGKVSNEIVIFRVGAAFSISIRGDQLGFGPTSEPTARTASMRFSKPGHRALVEPWPLAADRYIASLEPMNTTIHDLRHCGRGGVGSRPSISVSLVARYTSSASDQY